MSLKRYNEVCARNQVIGGREFSKGSIVRTVSLSDRDAAIMNEGTGTDYRDGHGMTYVVEQEKEPTEKELRAELFAWAKNLGLKTYPSMKTEDLRALIENQNA